MYISRVKVKENLLIEHTRPSESLCFLFIKNYMNRFSFNPIYYFLSVSTPIVLQNPVSCPGVAPAHQKINKSKLT